MFFITPPPLTKGSLQATQTGPIVLWVAGHGAEEKQSATKSSSLPRRLHTHRTTRARVLHAQESCSVQLACGFDTH